MADVKYEEKTYEQYFNIELKGNFGCFFFPPGQVLEGLLGFDAAVDAVDSSHRLLWDILRHTSPRGRILSDIAGNISQSIPSNVKDFSRKSAGKLVRKLNRDIEKNLDKLPTMTANLLFQYKKPEYITSRRGNEWGAWETEEGFQSIYYRYKIDPKQQALLSAICTYCKDTVHALYAAPAIQTRDELFEAFRNNKIVWRSNFTEASDHNEHGKITYIQRGIHSKGHSSPQEIKCIDLEKRIELLSQSVQTHQNNQDNKEFISDFAANISTIMEKNKDFSSPFRQLMKRFTFLRKKCNLLYSFLIMANFHILTGIQWLVIHENKSSERTPT